MGKAKSFRELLVWQRAHELVIETYRVTNLFPAGERFGLVSQMRPAVSVPANIAKGFVERSVRDKGNFYNISQDSLEGRLLNGLLSSLP